MHIALVNILAEAVTIRVEPRVTDASVTRVQVLAGTVGADAWYHRALVDVGTIVVFGRSRGT